MTWNQIEFDNFIMENGIVGFFSEPIKLKSGRISYWYVNWRNVAEDVFLMNELSNFLLEFIEYLKLDPDCFYGVPEGATKLGIISQFKWAMSKNPKKHQYKLVMGRANPKEHGDPKDRYFLGEPSGKIIILEDVTTTGGSLLSTIEKIQEINGEIISAIGLTNRDELRDDKKSVKEAVKEKGVDYYSMSNALELLPKIVEKEKLAPDIIEHVRTYFNNHGIKSIKL